MEKRHRDEMMLDMMKDRYKIGAVSEGENERMLRKLSCGRAERSAEGNARCRLDSFGSG